MFQFLETLGVIIALLWLIGAIIYGLHNYFKEG